MKEKIRPEDIEKALGVNTQSVRVGLQNGTLPFGWAIKTSETRHTYAISPKLCEEYIGNVGRKAHTE